MLHANLQCYECMPIYHVIPASTGDTYVAITLSNIIVNLGIAKMLLHKRSLCLLFGEAIAAKKRLGPKPKGLS